MRPPEPQQTLVTKQGICGAVLSPDELRLLLALRLLDAHTRQSVIDIALTAAGLGRDHPQTGPRRQRPGS